MRRTLLMCLLIAIPAGCSGPEATLELVRVARLGLAEAVAAEQAGYEQARGRLTGDAAALGAAFDADLQAAFAGRLLDAEGRPIEPDLAWLTEARQGYAAALALAYQNQRQADLEHRTRLDNLAASDEALLLAEQMLNRQIDLQSTLQRRLVEVQRRQIHD